MMSLFPFWTRTVYRTYIFNGGIESSRTKSRMCNVIFMVRRCSHMLPFNIRANVMKSLVLSQLDYCSEVWSSAAVTHIISDLQMVQNRAARCVLQCPFGTNVNWMHNTLSWLKVKERFTVSLLNLTRMIILTKSPKALYCRLNFSSDEHHYATRHATEGRFIRTNYGKRTMLYKAMFCWNNLTNDIVNAHSKSQFKVLLKRHLITS